MFTQQNLTLLVQILLIAGALHIGTLAYTKRDLVQMITGGGQLEFGIKMVIAAAGLFNAYQLFNVYTRRV